MESIHELFHTLIAGALLFSRRSRGRFLTGLSLFFRSYDAFSRLRLFYFPPAPSSCVQFRRRAAFFASLPSPLLYLFLFEVFRAGTV